MLDVLVHRFQLEDILKKSNNTLMPVLYTTDGKLVHSLKSLVRDHILHLVVEKREVVEALLQKAQVAVEVKPVEVKPVTPTTQFELWRKDYVAESDFLNACLDLQSSYHHLVQIGESYPYRCRLFLTSGNAIRSAHVWVYLVDQPGTTAISFVVHSKQAPLKELIQNHLNSANLNPANLLEVVEQCFKLVDEFTSKVPTHDATTPYLDDELIKLFPAEHKVIPTINESTFYSYCYKDEYTVATKTELHQSLAKETLMRSKGVVSMSTNHLNKTHTKEIRREKADLRSYKFDISNGYECPICMCDDTNAVQLLCGHTYCRDCITQFVGNELVMGKGNLGSIRCPAANCQAVLDQVTLATLMNAHQLAQNLDQYFNEYYQITNTNRCKFKPCRRLVYTYPNEAKVNPYVPCACNHTLCLNCGDTAIHWPIPCSGYHEDEHNEFDSFQYLINNTTSCPRCKLAVERISGCNHMMCSRCNTAFCYACGSFRNVNNDTHNCVADKKLASVAQNVIDSFKLGKSLSPQTLLRMMKARRDHSALGKVQGILQSILSASNDSNPLFQLCRETLELLIKRMDNTNRTEDNKIELTAQIQERISKLYSKTQHVARREAKPSIRVSSDNSGVMEKTLMCDISLNGYTNVLAQLFVNTRINNLKFEVVSALNRCLKSQVAISDATLDKVNLYCSKGYKIVSTSDIMIKDQLFVALNGEAFQEPQEQDMTELLKDKTSEPTTKKKKPTTHRLQPGQEKQPQRHTNIKAVVAEELNDLRTNPEYVGQQDQKAVDDEKAILEAICEDFDDMDYDDDEYYDEDDDEDYESAAAKIETDVDKATYRRLNLGKWL
ncbi:hypothetical protein SAMD00019534_039270 [Acytostelium subglobosum LB1]|uniref:hypothetical protein n=1 Tax=Acytostelium subglobosum LB1 TaxID=1410327 RepID=UPI00064511A6|nr:hypothetical protein SAMD00019534_039270 [Acytostelium subglobosum LB1]GAM20752.1 hypothetical protein SAMD00019534_039270 [Acytostelium subglobosum LB1]|eukprot:XP_012755886.1 hypothetical protein SAMD00019534_039270 [Acytostelium subglobosum LB1]